MSAVALCEWSELRAVKIHAIPMDVVGVFSVVFSTSCEDDLTFLGVNFYDLSDNPFPLSDAIFYGPCF